MDLSIIKTPEYVDSQTNLNYLATTENYLEFVHNQSKDLSEPSVNNQISSVKQEISLKPTKTPKEPKKRTPVFYTPVMNDTYKKIFKLESELYRVQDEEKITRLANELDQVQKGLANGDKAALKKKLKMARLMNESRNNRSFVYRVSKDKASSHASAAASCAKRFLNQIVRILIKCDRVRYQLMDSDKIMEEAYNLGILKIRFNTDSIEKWAVFDNVLRIFTDCNQCSSMEEFDLFCQKYSLAANQRDFFLTTRYQEKVKMAARKKGKELIDSSSIAVREEGDEIPIVRYFKFKVKIWLEIDPRSDLIESLQVQVQRRDDTTNDVLKTLVYKLEYAFKEVRNQSFTIYGQVEMKKRKLAEEHLLKNPDFDQTNVKPITKEMPIKAVPSWMQNVKISSLNKTENVDECKAFKKPKSKKFNKLNDLDFIHTPLISQQSNMQNSDSSDSSDSGNEDSSSDDDTYAECKLINSKKKQKTSQKVCPVNDQ